MTCHCCPWLREKVEMKQSGAENVSKTSAMEGKKRSKKTILAVCESQLGIQGTSL